MYIDVGGLPRPSISPIVRMTIEKAIRILDPETTAEALAEIEYYGGFFGQTAKVQAVTEACELAVAALRCCMENRQILFLYAPVLHKPDNLEKEENQK